MQFYSLAALAATATASFTNIDKAWPGVRNLVDQTGCWCNFGTNTALEGKGPASSPLDGYCKMLTESYKCIIAGEEKAMTEGKTNNVCVPWLTNYNSSWKLGMSDEEALQMCFAENSNGTSCQIKACAVESRFLNQLATVHAEDFLSQKRTTGFSVEESCPLTTVPVTEDGELACCKNQPIRSILTQINDQYGGTEFYR